MDTARHTVTLDDGASLSYAEAGSGRRPVVLIHGAMVTSDDMVISLFPSLAQEFRLFAFDRPGHGASQTPGVGGSPRRQARLIRDAVNRLGLEKPVILGHSFGGAVALAYGLQFADEITGVMALAPTVFPEPRLEMLVFGPRAGPLGPLSALLAAPSDALLLPILWRAMFLPQAMPQAFADRFPFHEAGSRRQTMAEGEDAILLPMGLARNALAYWTCRAPVRVLAGDRDLVLRNEYHGRLLARLNPAVRFDWLPGLGHMLHHFAQDRIAEDLRSMFAASSLNRAA